MGSLAVAVWHIAVLQRNVEARKRKEEYIMFPMIIFRVDDRHRRWNGRTIRRMKETFDKDDCIFISTKGNPKQKE
jgi:ribosomal protein L14